MSNNEFQNQEFEIVQDIWKTYKEFYKGGRKDDTEYWDKCVEAFMAIDRKYDSQFARELTSVFLSDIERRANT